MLVTALPRAVPGTFLRGDANADLRLNLADALGLLDYLHFAGAEPPCLDAADADDSGRLDLADALVLMNFLFLAGQALPPPGTRTPWFDPTGDDLSCGG